MDAFNILVGLGGTVSIIFLLLTLVTGYGAFRTTEIFIHKLFAITCLVGMFILIATLYVGKARCYTTNYYNLINKYYETCETLNNAPEAAKELYENRKAKIINQLTDIEKNFNIPCWERIFEEKGYDYNLKQLGIGE